MKQDVEIDAALPVPKKRRPLESTLDAQLAVWLAQGDLTPSERRRITEEKARRRVVGVKVIVGFTGTREGMTPQQRQEVKELLLDGNVVEAHHGDCVGADEQFHSLCRGLGVPVVLHPPTDPRLRAYCDGAIRSEKARPYLDRNKDIVREASLLIATPKEGNEPPPGRGQGTWSTVRYARARYGRIIVIMPNGERL
jgi:hypothetical protein